MWRPNPLNPPTTPQGSYVWLTFVHGGAANVPNHLLSFTWTTYGRADSRWAGYDTTVLSLELITVLAMGPLALACAWAITRRAAWRHVAQLIISICELYGGWMTFAPEWLARPVASPSLTSDPWMVFVFLGFMNLLWVSTPLLLAADSAIVLTRAADKAKVALEDDVPSGNAAYTAVAGTLVAYAVLVPYSLATAPRG